ncbi:MBL fold metallo-hydrolase [Alicyclobacillus macrosporangiidus]|uniref:MBL fold metallo-hydrolase n=1 Tax=Alicyclobacillus macrosporangiidus TaxID=392015 RepID=UPI0006896095|nr:MBL fold metallo-hydrolase [Alicyclobacillus macrosporangiidus]
MIQTTLTRLSPIEVFEKLLRGEPMFILDVRNEEEYADWRIEGPEVTSVNIPYFDLLDGVEPALKRLPKDLPVLVVCAKEGASVYVAEQLQAAGVTDVAVLAGGMKAWSEALRPVKVGDLTGGGAIYQFVRFGKGCLSYLIASDGEAAVVDAVRTTDAYTDFAAAHGLSIRHVMDTHLHADHISGGRKLAEQTQATYWLPPKDAAEVQFGYEPLVAERTILVGHTTVRIVPVYSPGHTLGSTSLVVDDRYLLSGDILFVKSIGRPDLAGKAADWAGDLRKTLYERYPELPSHLTLLPAHYGDLSEVNPDGSVHAKLGDVYATNAGLQVEDAQAFRTLVTENLPPQPNAYQEIRLTNMGRLQPDEDEQREMEIGPNRCAVHG